MRLRRLQVRHFQSLHDVDVELGRLTVVVGPSNAGKSALGRALRQLARNGPSSHVEHGQRTSTVTATLEDGTRVSLERGPSHSTYRVVTGDSEEVYAKSGTAVPEDVARLLGMPAGDGPDVHLTTQFDGPYLLDSNATTATKVLGDLTNVSLLAEASREAVRRRAEATRDARAARASAELGVRTVRERFGDLGARRALVDAVRATYEATRDHLARAEALTSAAEACERARADLARSEPGEVPDVDVAALEALRSTERDLRALAGSAEAARSAAARHEESAASSAELAAKSEAELHEALREAGHCPLCNRPTA